MGALGEAGGPIGAEIGYGKKFDGGMRCRHLRPQRSDSPGAHYRNAKLPSERSPI